MIALGTLEKGSQYLPRWASAGEASLRPKANFGPAVPTRYADERAYANSSRSGRHPPAAPARETGLSGWPFTITAATRALSSGLWVPRRGCQRPLGGINRASRTTLRNTLTGNRDTLARSEDHIDESGEFGKNIRAGGKPECRRLELQQVRRKQRRNRGNSGLRGNGRSWHGQRRKWHRNGRSQLRNRRSQHRNGRSQLRNRRHYDGAARRFRD